VFQKLIASKANDMYGFMLLRGILEHLPLSAYQQYMPTVWQLLFTRLQVGCCGRDSRACPQFGSCC
jgi:exportin-2 (importin alpha re-exporter)